MTGRLDFRPNAKPLTEIPVPGDTFSDFACLFMDKTVWGSCSGDGSQQVDKLF